MGKQGTLGTTETDQGCPCSALCVLCVGRGSPERRRNQPQVRRQDWILSIGPGEAEISKPSQAPSPEGCRRAPLPTGSMRGCPSSRVPLNAESCFTATLLNEDSGSWQCRWEANVSHSPRKGGELRLPAGGGSRGRGEEGRGGGVGREFQLRVAASQPRGRRGQRTASRSLWGPKLPRWLIWAGKGELGLPLLSRGNQRGGGPAQRDGKWGVGQARAGKDAAGSKALNPCTAASVRP